MNAGYIYLSKAQRLNAVQRLTALWAFTESGLGGIMHALQIPFTGLLVGGMAVIMISLIADISGNNYKQVLKSALIVLIVKAMVSPYTPFPAYIAVAFQAALGYGLFSLLKVNFLSIVLLSTIAMLESAIQKSLILTLFFGESLWKAMDSMMAFLANQFGSNMSHGSYWIVGIYLLIYLAGGFFIAWLAFCTIKSFKTKNSNFILNAATETNIDFVKAMVSPYTPFPAYLAVSFQAALGYGLFSLLKMNFLSIVLLSTIAMLESAIQKSLMLTLFFGESLWKAMDSMMAFLANQFGSNISHGSYWIVGIYLLIYLAGGFFIAWLAFCTIKSFKTKNSNFILHAAAETNIDFVKAKKSSGKNNFKKLWILILFMIVLSVLLFVFANDNKQGWLAVTKTITWTLSAILFWFMLIGPLFTKTIQKLLQKKESRYRDEVLKALSFLPVISMLTALAWQQSKLQRGFGRWHFFFAALIHATLTYSEPSSTEISTNKPL